MKTLFIKTEKKLQKQFFSLDFSPLPKKIGILCTIQFISFSKKIAEMLEKNSRKVFLSKPVQSKKCKQKIAYPCQILGCDLSAAKQTEKKVDAFLFLGSGSWHLSQLALLTSKPIFFLEGQKIKLFPKEKRKRLHSFRKGVISKFLFSDKVGILVSTKPGQQQLKTALKMRKKLQKQLSKKAFLFLADSINKAELENFSPRAWLNTVCPGLCFDIPSINPAELEDIFKN